MGFTREDFPPGFLFGAATSAYQIEGTRHGGAGICEWDTFAATPGNVVNAEDGSRGCDHYHRWPEDLDLMRDAGLDAYRFSISWSRVMPEGRGRVNAAGLDFYDRLLDGMVERGLSPWATLYHWELPAALADLGGWRNRDIADWFADYVDVVMRRLGDRIDGAAPINEPWCVAWLSHFIGQHAPGLRDIRATARAMHHVLLGHGRAIQAMRALGQTNLGAVMNLEFAQPADDGPEAAAAARTYDAIYNRWFLGGVLERRYPEEALAGLGPHMPKGWEQDLDLIAAPLDWIGINYYTRKLIAPAPGPWPALREVPGPLPRTDMGWEIYPDGIRHFLKRVNALVPAGTRIYVTENGMAASEPREDLSRIGYLRDHLAALRRAMAEGARLDGYFTWSLLDNYEWSLGYGKRFGLVHVDFDTMERTPKASWHALRAALTPAG
ncbi:GH1 family beta-glucosidase [Amaricoccus solimangrovi]|uniref:GH1 family beta-glucosidase n=1 Tax=Amaricoccus solimangrovi TaxID=2589815 RepID=UPI0015E4619F|nr:GH1 family beta-glucosidase [Amaricoccus solimangrovi]